MSKYDILFVKTVILKLKLSKIGNFAESDESGILTVNRLMSMSNVKTYEEKCQNQIFYLSKLSF